MPLGPPSAPITGDSHAHLLEPLAKLAAEIGFTFAFSELDGSCGGFCDYRAKPIVVEARRAPNAKVRVVVHELAHALGGASRSPGDSLKHSTDGIKPPPTSPAPRLGSRPTSSRSPTSPGGVSTARWTPSPKPLPSSTRSPPGSRTRSASARAPSSPARHSSQPARGSRRPPARQPWSRPSIPPSRSHSRRRRVRAGSRMPAAELPASRRSRQSAARTAHVPSSRSSTRPSRRHERPTSPAASPATRSLSRATQVHPARRSQPARPTRLPPAARQRAPRPAETHMQRHVWGGYR